MIRFKLKLVALIGGLSFLVLSCQQDEESPLPDESLLFENSSQVIPGQYIVVFKEDALPNARMRFTDNYQQSQQLMLAETRNILAQNNLKAAAIANVYSKTILGAVMKLDGLQLTVLKQDQRVKYIEQDRVIALRPPWERDGNDGGGGSEGQEKPYGITRVNGGITYTGSNVAWIIDSGIDLDHEDLNVDASRGFNAFTKGPDGESMDDLDGHGTHVAGTVAAIDNNVGVIGVAAGATVIPVKVLDRRGSGSYSGVIGGIDHVGANGNSGDVANMSLGGGFSQSLNDAVIAASEKGILFSIAAGNEGADANNYSPASANGTNIYTISAINSADRFASWSNFGNPPVDFAAPGVSIKSTWKDGGYNTISGTSMAAPHAAGVLLLGNPSTDGFVKDDKDNTPDPIIAH